MQDDQTLTHVSNPFPTESELYFPVVERDNAWIDKHGKHHVIKKHKSLIRALGEGAERVAYWLANVGIDFEVVLNSELFPHIEKHMLAIFTPEQLLGLIVNEQMSYNGRDCYREYIFKSITCDIGNGGDICFRLIVGNSYGSKAVSLLYGAIDWWCTNGMITGEHEKKVRRHTSGITLDGIDEWIDKGLAQFTSHGATMWRWNHTPIPERMRFGLFLHLSESGIISAQLCKQMETKMLDECYKRAPNETHLNGLLFDGPNLWHLYSALTQWATHDDVRKTTNDHEANTRIQRSQQVARVMTKADAWLERETQLEDA